MTPTLLGRIQTRILLVLSVGVLWGAVIAPVLPTRKGTSLGDVYWAVGVALGLVLVVGMAWELVYHAVQQFRWEKDWPTIFGLLTGLTEAAVVYVLMDSGVVTERVANVHPPAFVIHFATTWLLIWAVAQGPLQIVFLRWRFRGGRLL